MGDHMQLQRDDPRETAGTAMLLAFPGRGVMGESIAFARDNGAAANHVLSSGR
jgi:hypothetical protein